MAQRAKMTGFARFLIFLIIVVPLAYFGAASINGDNGVSDIKNLLKIESNSNNDRHANLEEAQITIERLEEEIKYKDQQLKNLAAENEALKQALQALGAN